jgi:hypothetical protein
MLKREPLPAGGQRLGHAHDRAIAAVLWPKLLPILLAYPDIQVIEFTVDYRYRG